VRRPLHLAALLAVPLALLATAPGCPKAGGAYLEGDRPEGYADRGETQGRMFDFVSNKPDGDDWQIRLRGSSLWASYASEEDAEELGSRNLAAAEAEQLWDLIDRLELPDRKQGKPDEDAGYVQLRLREPGGGDDDYVFFTAIISRDTEDDDVLELADYLIELIEKHHGQRPSF